MSMKYPMRICDVEQDDRTDSFLISCRFCEYAKPVAVDESRTDCGDERNVEH